MSKAIRIEKAGGPDVMLPVEVTVGQPGPGEIRIRHKAVGLNYIDVYHRDGTYPLPLPLSPGMEASGVVEAVGEGVTHLRVEDRAAYASGPVGSYCEERVMPAKCVCRLPDAIDFDTGAAMMLKGITAQYLLRRACNTTEPRTIVLDGTAIGEWRRQRPGNFSMKLKFSLTTKQQIRLEHLVLRFAKANTDRDGPPKPAC